MAWGLELTVLVAPAPPPLRLRLVVPEAMEMAAATLTASIFAVSAARISRLVATSSRTMPLPVVVSFPATRLTPAMTSPLILFVPSTAPIASAALVLLLCEITRAPPAALAFIFRSLLARIAKVPTVMVPSEPPVTFLI